ncbi:glycosyltransferase family 25 protein [bacterium]|nr:glycosyltransferase family 25 protein [bacterium]
MEKSKDRLERMERQIAILGKPFQRIAAVDGSLLTTEQITKASETHCRLFCTRSMIGIYMSHLKAWRTMIDNGDGYAMIMEDDCSLVPSFQNELKLVLDELNTINPEWDFLYLGCFGACDPNKKYDVIGYAQRMMTHILKKSKMNSEDLTYSFVPETPIGFHCYIVSHKCAKYLVNAMKKASYHVDVAFLEHADSLNVYATKKQLSYQYTSAESSTQTDSFPIIPNTIFEKIVCSRNISYGYYFSAPIFAIGKFNANFYLFLFVLIALLIPNEYSYFLLYYLVLETILSPMNLMNILLWGAIAILVINAKQRYS